MLRQQLSAARRTALSKISQHHNHPIKGRGLVRFSANRRSVERQLHPRHQQHRQQQQQQHRQQQQRRRTEGWSNNIHGSGSYNARCTLSGRDLPSFHRLRACYFSNAAERTVGDVGAEELQHEHELELQHELQHEHETKIGATGSDPAHEIDPTLNFVRNLKLWYLEHHGENGSVVQDAFDAQMIPNPFKHGGSSSSSSSSSSSGSSGGDRKDSSSDAIQQLFTATFTCPFTNERFRAGKLPGCYTVDQHNYYSKKKTALQAVSAVVLSHKQVVDNAGDHERTDGADSNRTASVADSSSSSSSSSSTNDNDNDNGNSFRHELQKLYTKTFKVSPTKSQSRMTKHCFVGKEYGGSWWTADFCCPITGKVYEAADLPPESIAADSVKMREAGRIWYRKKADAIHASALTAIDAIDWEAEAERQSQTQTQTQTQTEPIANDLAASGEPGGSSKSIEILRPLVHWYKTHRGLDETDLSIEDDHFVVTGGTESKGRQVWTATFLCPLTGERFDSGTITADDAVRVTELELELDDLNWYTDPDAAKKAASFRAYDCLKYRETGVNDPRFCREDPSWCGAETNRLPKISHDGVPETDGEDDNDDTYFAFDEAAEAAGDDEDDDEYEEDDDEDEDDDDFVIEVIPQQLNLSPGVQSGSSKTLDIIAQAWIDSTGISSNRSGPQNEVQSPNNMVAERQKTMRRAMEWVAQQQAETVKAESDRTQFDVTGQIGNLKIANAILSSLAETHQRIPFDSRPSGVEDCAAAILESMWSSRSTKPDAQSYAFYLKCLEGESPTDIVERAQKIVDAMESGHEYQSRLLPKPVDSVYNGLAELKALAGIYPLVETSDGESLDRNMHLCHLSVMAHNPNMFDIDLATKHIDQMKTLSEIHNCPPLHPDVEVYNAPLRWSGGSLWSRLYSRVIPWDSYGTIYKNGFLSESNTDVSRTHAEQIEEWIEMMTTKAASGDDAVSPNIETYESLIQAWVRCGSMDGLLRAEAIAKKMIAGDYCGVQPRLESFYPILGAWTYSGCDEGPQRVESWIDLIHSQGIDPETDLRLRFPNLPIIAEISLQRQISSQSGDPLDSWNSVRESASRCSELLDRAMDRSKKAPGVKLQTDMFMLAINAWYISASAAIANGDLEEARQCSREIQKVVNLFDDALVRLYRTHRAEEGNKSHFFGLLNQAPSIYGAQVAVMNSLNAIVDRFENGSREDGVAKQFILIEEKIRRLEEFHFFLAGEGNAVSDPYQNIEIEPKSMTPFPSEGFVVDSSCKDWTDFIDLSLDSIGKGAQHSTVGEADFIRLCMLITRVASSAAPTVLNPDTKNSVIDKIGELLENYGRQNQDRKSIVSSLVQSLKKWSGTLRDTGTKAFLGEESRYGANDLSDAENGQDFLTAAHAHTKRKVRRKRPRGSDLHRSSYSRSRVPNRTRIRRTRPHRAKTNEL